MKKQISEYATYPKNATSIRNSPLSTFPRIGTITADPKTTAILGSAEEVDNEVRQTKIDQSRTPCPVVPALAKVTETSTREGFAVTKLRMERTSACSLRENSWT